jgi:hypothetical protein
MIDPNGSIFSNASVKFLLSKFRTHNCTDCTDCRRSVKDVSMLSGLNLLSRQQKSHMTSMLEIQGRCRAAPAATQATVGHNSAASATPESVGDEASALIGG